ncbi:hypothetical protein LX36DRAFT_660288 [Colletotrichum falcatum]|nr:hypothetical protein LX36DRAFT_660288 [Colletotrichum falcatum]
MQLAASWMSACLSVCLSVSRLKARQRGGLGPDWMYVSEARRLDMNDMVARGSKTNGQGFLLGNISSWLHAQRGKEDSRRRREVDNVPGGWELVTVIRDRHSALLVMYPYPYLVPSGRQTGIGKRAVRASSRQGMESMPGRRWLR